MKIIISEQQKNKLLQLSEQSSLGKISKLSYQSFTNDDTDVFKKILSGIGAPITPETMGFMYAWRQGEMSLASEEKFYCNNPFSTTWDTDPKGSRKSGIFPGDKNSTMYSRTNSHRVKSYKSIETGTAATIKTILRNYPNIVSALKTPNINCYQMATNCSSDLDKWGTSGNAVKSITSGYLKGQTPKPKPINRGEGCY